MNGITYTRQGDYNLPNLLPHAGAGGSLWEIRIASEEVSERTPQDHLHEPVDQRAALQPSGGDRADGPAPDGADGDTDGQRERRDGGAEGARPDEVGRADEQPSERSGGNHTEKELIYN